MTLPPIESPQPQPTEKDPEQQKQCELTFHIKAISVFLELYQRTKEIEGLQKLQTELKSSKLSLPEKKQKLNDFISFLNHSELNYPTIPFSDKSAQQILLPAEFFRTFLDHLIVHQHLPALDTIHENTANLIANFSADLIGTHEAAIELNTQINEANNHLPSMLHFPDLPKEWF